MTVTSLRSDVAGELQTNEACKLFYHKWSMDGQVKEFSGRKPVQTAGISGSIIFGGGITGGLGLYMDDKTGEYGLYWTAGAGAGFEVGAGPAWASYDSLDDMCGASMSFNAGYGPLGLSWTGTPGDPNLFNLQGAGYSKGPTFTPKRIGKVGVSVTAGHTGKIPLSPYIEPIFQWTGSELEKLNREIYKLYGIPRY